MYNVIIVEDDLMVSAILKKHVSRFSQLKLVNSFKRCRETLDFLNESPKAADLIILDYFLPEMTGIEFLRELRKTNVDIQVIMITSADEYSIIRSAMCCGVCDYLLKPFTSARLEKAVSKFEATMKLVNDTHVWTQDRVDALLSPHKHYSVDASGEREKAAKINPITMDNIKNYLSAYVGKKMPLLEISEGIGLSTVTVRRYLKQLNAMGEVEITLDCKTGGRPSEIFEYLGDKTNE